MNEEGREKPKSSPSPQWQPISMLLNFTEMIDGMLESSVEQTNNMRAVEHKPHVMDDATMKRIIKLDSASPISAK